MRKTLTKLRAAATLRQGFGTVFDQGLYSLSNFLVGVLLARALPQEDYGAYVLFLSVIMSIMGVQRALISSPYTIHCRSYEPRRLAQYTGSAAVHEMILMAAVVFLGFALTELGSTAGTGASLSVAFVVAAVGILIRDFARFFLLSALRIRQSLLIGFSTNALLLAATGVLFVTGRLSVVSALVVIGLCSLTPSVIVFLVNAKLTLSEAPVVRDFLHNLKLGKWMLGTAAISVLSSQAYLWLLAFFADARAIAILGVTSSLANLLSPLLQGANAFLLPKMVQSREQGGVAAITQTAKGAALFLGAIFSGWLVCGIVFGDFLLSAIYSTKYSGYGGVLAILIVYSVASAVTVPISMALDALQRSEISFKSSLAALLVTLPIGMVLIYEWGVYGAALSVMLANVTNLLLRWRGLSLLIEKLKNSRMAPANLGTTSAGPTLE